MITDELRRHIKDLVATFAPLTEHERHVARSLMRPAWLEVQQQRAAGTKPTVDARRARRAA